MITVGYGDITPQNSYERIYVMVITIISCGVFAYAVNTVGSIFQKMDSEESSLRLLYLNRQNFFINKNFCWNR